MLINQTLNKLDALGLFGMGLGLREQLESSQYLSLSFDERLGLLVDREAETRVARQLDLPPTRTRVAAFKKSAAGASNEAEPKAETPLRRAPTVAGMRKAVGDGDRRS